MPGLKHAPQSKTITLKEFEACEVALPPEAYEALKSRYAGRVEVAPTGGPGVYRLAARDYIGRVGLPGAGLLVIQPKVEVANLFHMLCSDTGLVEFNPPPTGLDSSLADRDIARFVAFALLSAVSRLLEGGLYREYVPRQESIVPIRGRIALGRQIARYGSLKHRHVCAWPELTTDTPENRVVAASLRLLPRMLDPNREEERTAARKARALLVRLEGVKAVPRREATALLRGINRHRLNAAYGPALGLCRLVLHSMSFDEQEGPYPFASFLVNMPRLFESFLTARLRLLLPQYGLRAVAQRRDYLDEDRLVGIRPDLLVYSQRRDEHNELAQPRRGPSTVLDFKYRLHTEPGAGLNGDLYQLGAYADRYGLHSGGLVYPQFGGNDGHTAPVHLKLKGSGKQLHLLTVNLAASTAEALEAECSRLAEQVASLLL